MGMSENMNPEKSYRRPKLVAGTVLVAGLLASVAGNVQSILLEDGAPGVGSMISALWWPAILFGMIELAIHTPWGKSALWLTVQWSGSVVIGGVAFYISYFHLAHVLSSFGYDTVSRYVGPIAVDVAMGVATLAMNRIGHAQTAGQMELATAATLANLGGQTEPVATDEMASVAADWATLDSDLDEELANMVASAQSAPEPAAAEEPAVTVQPAPEPAADRSPVKLTAVPAEAAKRIQDALAENPKATAAALARDLVAAGLAEERTGRRYVAAIKNNTARVA